MGIENLKHDEIEMEHLIGKLQDMVANEGISKMIISYQSENGGGFLRCNVNNFEALGLVEFLKEMIKEEIFAYEIDGGDLV